MALRARDVADLLECLSSMHIALCSIPTLHKAGLVAHTPICNANTQKVEMWSTKIKQETKYSWHVTFSRSWEVIQRKLYRMDIERM